MSPSPSWGRKARQFRAHLAARVTPGERRTLAAWARPEELEIFDRLHVADRRHGLDVVAHLRRSGVTDRDVLAAGPELPTFVAYIFVYFTFYMVGLGFINLIPIPPFDGSAILMRFLSPRQAWQVRTFTAQYGMMVVLAILIIASPVISRVISSVTFTLLGA